MLKHNLRNSDTTSVYPIYKSKKKNDKYIIYSDGSAIFIDNTGKCYETDAYSVLNQKPYRARLLFDNRNKEIGYSWKYKKVLDDRYIQYTMTLLDDDSIYVSDSGKEYHTIVVQEISHLYPDPKHIYPDNKIVRHYDKRTGRAVLIDDYHGFYCFCKTMKLLSQSNVHNNKTAIESINFKRSQEDSLQVVIDITNSNKMCKIIDIIGREFDLRIFFPGEIYDAPDSMLLKANDLIENENEIYSDQFYNLVKEYYSKYIKEDDTLFFKSWEDLDASEYFNGADTKVDSINTFIKKTQSVRELVNEATQYYKLELWREDLNSMEVSKHKCINKNEISVVLPYYKFDKYCIISYDSYFNVLGFKIFKHISCFNTYAF